MDALTITVLAQQQPRVALRYESKTARGNVWCPVCIIAANQIDPMAGWQWVLIPDASVTCYCCGSVLNPRTGEW